MYTIGQLSQLSGLSRSTLLYYDRKGLLNASTRTDSNYRLYNQDDLSRLQLILDYRQTGIGLDQIKLLLDSPASQSANLLEQRLNQLNVEIAELRQQQTIIVKLLENDTLHRKSRALTKQNWVEILKATGLSDEDMQQWHTEFERKMPQAHQDFLESLGIEKIEIKAIRKRAKHKVDLNLVNTDNDESPK